MSPGSFLWRTYGFLRALGTGTFIFGSGRKCPLCGGEFRRFLPFGSPSRPESQCPGCGSRERQRLLWLYIEEEGLLESSENVLHFSPDRALEAKLHEYAKEDGLDYCTTDLSDDGTDVVADIREMPFEESSFSLVICSHVLEHVPDDVEAMEEVYRILEPGGEAVFMVPIHGQETFEDIGVEDRNERKKIFGHPEHVRICGEDYFERFKEAGFSVDVFQYAKEFSEEEIERFGLRVHGKDPEFEYIISCSKE